jgi:hypothetical protein
MDVGRPMMAAQFDVMDEGVCGCQHRLELIVGFNEFISALKQRNGQRIN